MVSAATLFDVTGSSALAETVATLTIGHAISATTFTFVHGLPGLGRIFGATQADHKCLGLTTRTLTTFQSCPDRIEVTRARSDICHAAPSKPGRLRAVGTFVPPQADRTSKRGKPKGAVGALGRASGWPAAPIPPFFPGRGSEARVQCEFRRGGRGPVRKRSTLIWGIPAQCDVQSFAAGTLSPTAPRTRTTYEVAQSAMLIW